MVKINKYNIFKYHGKDATEPAGYKHIWANLFYDFNHCGCHSSILVACGYFNEIPVKSIYSGRVYLCGIWLLVSISDINEVEMGSTNSLNEYFEAGTLDKSFIILANDFGYR